MQKYILTSSQGSSVEQTSTIGLIRRVGVWLCLVITVSTSLALTGCIEAPDYPDAPPSGTIVLINSLWDEDIVTFRIRAAGTSEWKGYNYITLINDQVLKPDEEVTFHVPPGPLDIRVESDGERYWTYFDFSIAAGEERELEILD